MNTALVILLLFLGGCSTRGPDQPMAQIGHAARLMKTGALAEAEQDRVNAKHFLECIHNRNRSAFPDVERTLSEAIFKSFLSSYRLFTSLTL